MHVFGIINILLLVSFRIVNSFFIVVDVVIVVVAFFIVSSGPMTGPTRCGLRC